MVLKGAGCGIGVTNAAHAPRGVSWSLIAASYDAPAARSKSGRVVGYGIRTPPLRGRKAAVPHLSTPRSCRFREGAWIKRTAQNHARRLGRERRWQGRWHSTGQPHVACSCKTVAGVHHKWRPCYLLPRRRGAGCGRMQFLHCGAAAFTIRGTIGGFVARTVAGDVMV